MQEFQNLFTTHKLQVIKANEMTKQIFTLLILSLLNLPTQCYAKQTETLSLILGLTHSRSILPYPKSSLDSTNKPNESEDMMEPLIETRDGYLISLTLGSPPQVISVYMDTGSDLTWVPCGNLSFDCIKCDDYRTKKLMPTFSPSHSSTSSRDSCSSAFCIDVHSSDNSYDPCTVAGCSLSTLLKGTCSRPCPSFSYTYGEGIVIGSLTRDILRVHGTSPNSTHEIPEFCFGCVGSAYKEPIGIVGFGKGPLSLPSQLGFIRKGFSHCFLAFTFANNPNMSSTLVIGETAISSKNDGKFTPMLNNPSYPNYYYIGLEAISVGRGTSSTLVIPLNLREFDSKGNGGMLIDSGTTYTHLPDPLYYQLISNLEKAIGYPRAKDIEDRTGFDLCYRVPCPNNTLSDDILPTITLHFLNNVSLILPKGNTFYAMGAPNNFTVTKCLLLQSMDDGEEGPAGVFGSFQQQNVEVVYDLEKERIGFQPTDCANNAAYHGLHKG